MTFAQPYRICPGDLTLVIDLLMAGLMKLVCRTGQMQLLESKGTSLCKSCCAQGELLS